jgi:2-polyprenyl-3-methyl-5-hydroxy-6-metoxy-1,4-benzoquinol methylase
VAGSRRSRNIPRPTGIFKKEIGKMDAASHAQLTDERIREMQWYYSVELKPHAFTQGERHPNMMITKALLSRIDLRGMRLLDIGAQEGLFSVLTARAGASVFTYDRRNLQERVELIKHIYGVNFSYYGGIEFREFVSKFHIGQEELFDCIVFSGVLYHTIDPTVFAYLVRTLLKPGGIIVLETAAMKDQTAALFLNSKSRLAPRAIYHASTGWLDYYLRNLGFRIVDIESTMTKEARNGRVAFTCVLTNDPVIEPDDEYGKARLLGSELSSFQALRQSESVAGEERVNPARYADDLYIPTIAQRTLDLTRTVKTKPAMIVNREECVLRLTDRLG